MSIVDVRSAPPPSGSLAEFLDSLGGAHPDLHLHDPGGPRECLVRPGELVATPEGLARALNRLGRWVDRVDHAPELALARIRLRPAEHANTVRIAAEADPDIPVAPNHVHLGCPVLLGQPVMFGTGGTPADGPLVPAPRHELWAPPISVAVLDTGLDPHPWFADRPWLTDWGLSPEVLDGDGVPGQDRQAGHGTFVAGVLLRHAPGAVLRHHRVLSSVGLTDDVTVAAGLRRIRHTARDQGEHLSVLVLTAGCHTASDRCPPVLRRELDRFRDATVVAAAGNGATTRPFWPAALPTVLAVAATGPDGELAEFSNRGPWVDAAAPGVDVVSSFVRLRPTAGVAAGTENREYGYAQWSGTSFAAPAVAGVIAALRHQGHSRASAWIEACRRHPVQD